MSVKSVKLTVNNMSVNLNSFTYRNYLQRVAASKAELMHALEPKILQKNPPLCIAALKPKNFKIIGFDAAS